MVAVVVGAPNGFVSNEFESGCWLNVFCTNVSAGLLNGLVAFCAPIAGVETPNVFSAAPKPPRVGCFDVEKTKRALGSFELLELLELHFSKVKNTHNFYCGCKMDQNE